MPRKGKQPITNYKWVQYVPKEPPRYHHPCLSPDFRIVCRGLEFKVHKIMLGATSDLLCRACFQDYTRESFDCSTDDPELIRRMLDMFYHDDYDGDATVSNDQSDAEKAQRNIHLQYDMMVLAEKYESQPLLKIAAKKHCNDLIRHREYFTVSDLMNVLIQKGWPEDLREGCFQLLPKTFPPGIPAVMRDSALIKIIEDQYKACKEAWAVQVSGDDWDQVPRD